MRFLNPKLWIDGEELRLDNPLALSFIGTTAALLAGTLAGAGASVASGVMGSSAAKSAASQQAAAAKYSSNLISQGLGTSLGLEKQMFDASQSNIQPWLDAGRQGLLTMSDMLQPGGSLLQGFSGNLPTAPTAPGPFASSPEAMAAGYQNLPTALRTAGWKGPVTDADVKAQFDPGFQYRMDLSNKAINAWAAAKGSLDSPATAMKLIRNAQEMGSQEYQNAFQRAIGLNQQTFGQGAGLSQSTFGQGFQPYTQGFQNQLAQYGAGLQGYGALRDTFYTNQGNQFQRLGALSGMGQQAGTSLATLGGNYANTVGGLTMGAMQGMGQAAQGGAAAQAAGTVGASNAWTNALGNLTNSFMNYATMYPILTGSIPTNSPMPRNYYDTYAAYGRAPA